MAVLEPSPSTSREMLPANEPLYEELDERLLTWGSPERDNGVLKPHKPLPRKRDTTISSITSPDLRAQYRSSSSGALDREVRSNGLFSRSGSSLMHTPTTPVLPPTPPVATHENGDFSHDESSVADTTILRSSVVTPITQHSPPTPDQTPPRQERDLALRPWLVTQPSLASTRAESFATAREEFLSDTESEHSAPHWVLSRSRNASHQSMPMPRMPDQYLSKLSPLVDITPRTPQAVWEDDDIWNSHELEQTHKGADSPSPPVERNSVSSVPTHGDDDDEPLSPLSEELFAEEPDLHPKDEPEVEKMDDQARLAKGTELDSPTLPQYNFVTPDRTRGMAVEPNLHASDPIESSGLLPSRLPQPTQRALNPTESFPVKEVTPRRGPSLRDRLDAMDRDGPTASTENFANQIGWSGVDEQNTRNLSTPHRLSGISTSLSTVDAMVFDSEPRRVKTIRRQTKSKSLRTASSPLPDSNRSSILTNPYTNLDSPPRHSLSHKKAKLSNQNRLSYGSDVSRSLSISSAATPSKPDVIRVAVIPERRSSRQSSGDNSRRHSTTQSLSSSGYGRQNIRGHRLSSDSASGRSGNTTSYPPVVPARGSSLSAPTSRNNSKANSRSNSITSENFRHHRLQAERDLRKTLDRMESERIGPTVKALVTAPEDMPEPSPAEPGTAKWASLRPKSELDTPFSQPSVMTASVDGASIEMGEARAVNLFPHHNDSLQLIEKHPLPESQAVRSLRHKDPASDLTIVTDGPSTPRAVATEIPSMVSPLRHPREPPPTPAVASQATEPVMGQLHSQTQQTRRYNSLRRPSPTQHYSASFIKSMTRGLSLRNARNPKSEHPESLDPRATPMWRPRRFWDDAAEYTEDESETYSEGDAPKRNTATRDLSTQPRRSNTISGPVSLLRSLSVSGSRTRTRQPQSNRYLYKQSSHGSMSRLRAAGRLYRVPGSRGVHFRFVGLGGWAERMRQTRGRKEDERREERRRMLRDAIRPEVVMQGDSRFVAEHLNGNGIVNGNGGGDGVRIIH